MAANKKWGVTQVIVRYVSGDDTWEIALDPKHIDVLVFNWERFKKVNGVVGDPISKKNHVRPDGRLVEGNEPAEEVAKKIGLNGPPKKVGPRESGTGDDPICIHNQNCTWWCLDENHTHDPPPPPGP
jgi:hypothetical protein